MSDRKMEEKFDSFIFDEQLAEQDPILDELIKLETERQSRRIVLVPSESICSPMVRKVLDSPLSNLYAEGYPSNSTNRLFEDDLSDLPFQLTHYRRYSDRRFYKGSDYVNSIEAICRRRAAECFANDKVPSEQIFANVQPLSGAPANLAILDALLNPGDVMMGMDLMQGGHLSHGSPFHVTGRNYRIVSYGIDLKTEKFDYDEIMAFAKKHRPKLIIAGFTSYPWAPDWEKFRAIADEVGAYLMADIAHPAGLAIAGAYPSPIGYADVISFTTHKTLMGPRGAVILSTNEEMANRINMAVFPGQQGGPHENTIAALAVAFKIAKTDKFKKLAFDIVDNAKYMAECLQKEGLGLSYGGTDTHLFLADLKTLGKKNGEYLLGEPAARILEMAGVVTNKNTIPGDKETPLCTGIRMGTPWITQRGINKEQIAELSHLMVKLLSNVQPFHYDGVTRALPRGKVDLNVLDEVRQSVDELAAKLDVKTDAHSNYPHYHFNTAIETKPVAEKSDADTKAVVIPTRMIKVTGPRVDSHVQNLLTHDISNLADGEAMRSLMLNPDGTILDDVVVIRVGRRWEDRETGFCIIPTTCNCDKVLKWMRGHADGYLLFEPTDITAKVEGPAVVEDFGGSDFAPEKRRALMHIIGKDAVSKAAKLAKVIGDEALLIKINDADDAIVTVPYLKLEDALAKCKDADIAPSSMESEKEWRESIKLPIHADGPIDAKIFAEENGKEWFDLYKPYFIGQLKIAEGVAPEKELPEFSWEEVEGEIKRTPLYEDHVKASARIVPFAGHEMPVWYTSFEEEHTAVRTTAGLFDVSHMGCFGISGPNAADFLDLVTANYIRWIGDGEAHYSYLFDPDGNVIDDIYVYRYAYDRYLMVVNASNEAKDWDWLTKVNNGEVLIDRQVPQRRNMNKAILRNLKDEAHGEDRKVDIAFQGPKSLKILMSLCDNENERFRLSILKRNGCMELTVAGIAIAVSRTGYTGEEFSYELFVHPEKASTLWNTILDTGKDMGVVPIGLGARDSLRVEAGFPLYGHELAGDLGIWPNAAGFPGYVKFHKPFFIGKQPVLAKERKRKDILVRFMVTTKGVRAARTGDPVVSTRGEMIGYVTSAAGDPAGNMVGLALVKIKAAKQGPISIYSLGGSKKLKGSVPNDWKPGDKTPLAIPANIVSRFPARKNVNKKMKITELLAKNKG